MTKHYRITLILLVSIFFFRCNQSPEKQSVSQSEQLIELDNIAGLKNKRHFHLSEFVDSIEYIKLETNKNCLLSGAYKAFSDKYLVFATVIPANIFIFNRQGKFIRSIGKQGQGPGEYSELSMIDISPKEDKIIIEDGIQKAFIEYDIIGSHIQTIKLSAPLVLKGPFYIGQDNVVYIQNSMKDSLDFPRVVALNLKTHEEIPINIVDFERLYVSHGAYIDPEFIRIDNGVLFKDCVKDTLYQIGKDLSLIPKVVQDIGDNIPPSFMIPMESQYDRVGMIFDLPNHLLMIGSYQERFHQVFDKKSGELFALPRINNCKWGTYDYGIINDIDGLEPYWPFTELYIRDNSFFVSHQVIDLKEWCKTTCFTEAELVSEIYRNRLKGILEHSDIQDNPIIRVMHLKR